MLKFILFFRFEFTTFDDHSGLKEIHWVLHDTQNTSRIHGQGHIAVRKPSVNNGVTKGPVFILQRFLRTAT